MNGAKAFPHWIHRTQAHDEYLTRVVVNYFLMTRIKNFYSKLRPAPVPPAPGVITAPAVRQRRQH